MRISEQAKQEIHSRILANSVELFCSKGFGATTTRDIASATGIATGTLFNYFPSKETLAMHLVASKLQGAQAEYQDCRDTDDGLVEDLFLFLATGLRHIKSYRSFLGPVFEKSLSPFPSEAPCPEGEKVKELHLQQVQKILGMHGYDSTLNSAPMNLYWSLYLGMLAFWVNDSSPKQQETLAMIDYSLRVFAQSIAGVDCAEESRHV